MDFSDEMCERTVTMLEKIELAGECSIQASTTIFLIPKNVTSERPIAIFAALNRWWEVLPREQSLKWLTQQSRWRRLDCLFCGSGQLGSVARRELHSVLCGSVAHERGAEPLQTNMAILPGSGRSVLLSRIVVREAITVSCALYPRVRVRASVDDVKMHLTGKSVFDTLKEHLQEVKMEKKVRAQWRSRVAT